MNNTKLIMGEELKECQCKTCLLKSAPVSVLNEDELEIFCNNSISIAFQKGEKIIKQGAFVTNIFFVKSGIIKLHLSGPIHRDEILKIDKGPTFIGIPDAFANKTHTYSVTALNDLETCSIDFPIFKYLIEKNGRFATEVLTTLSDDVIKHFRKCVNKTQKQLTAILAEALIYLADEIFESDEFEVPLTRSEFGGYIGTTRETVTKIIHDFTTDNIIDVSNKKIKILNKNILHKISNTG